MSKQYNLFLDFIKKFALSDRVNGLLLLASILLLIINIVLSKFTTAAGSLFTKIGISPLSFLIAVYLINILLALTSYNKEKEISYLLFISLILVSLLIFALNIFYLTNGNL